MKQWIKMMNKMYEENSCTCNGRVVISYDPVMNIVIIKVFRKYEIVECDTYTDWGVMLKIQEVVKEMYEAV